MLRRHPRLTGALVGLAVMTSGLAYLFNSDMGRRLELLTFDLRIRYYNRLNADQPILHVDIDDNALARVGRWPWHRDQIADVIRAMHELGAANILVDLLLSEPEAPYIRDPRLTLYGDFDEASLGDLSEDNYIYPDLELAAAIREAGNVVLAMEMNPEDAAARRRDDSKVALCDKVVALLTKKFTLTDDELAAELKVPHSAIDTVIAGAKTRVARESVQRLAVSNGSVPSRELVLQALLGDKKDVLSADRIDVEKALFALRSLEAARRNWPRAETLASGRLLDVYEATPPCLGFVESAAAVAAVNFVPDSDGAVRRVPLVMRQQGRAAMHMGLIGACRILGLDAQRLNLRSDNTLVIPARSGTPMEIPLDKDGNMIIHWAAHAARWRDDADHPHITAAKLYELVDARRQIEHNRTLRNYKLADVVAVTKGEVKINTAGSTQRVVNADNAYRKKVNDYLAAKRRLRMARLNGRETPEQLKALEAQAATLSAEIEKEQQQAVAAVRLTMQDIKETPADEIAKDPALAEQVKRYQWAADVIDKDIAAIDAANQRMEQAAAIDRSALAEKIHGKNVFLGYAATAEGDIVPTPIDRRTMGVMCHAHVLNSILQRQFIVPVPRHWEALAGLLIGTVVTVLTATRGPRLALLATLAIMLLYFLVNAYYAFMTHGLWIAMAAPLITVFVTWAFVTLFRQFTAEREKRLFSKQLSQYTSPIIAARIAESPDAAAVFKKVQTRDMTIFFSDLAGFTTLSEQENPETIQRVLNIYLERMSRVIWAYRGLINKFMGDGIMAFFNPSVDPLEDHARMACETSLATLEELDRLKAEFMGDPAARIFDKLSMRIGLSAGLCKNGDLGSELKADYTVIGDVVNLAARLEPANKVFGTRIMVSGPLRDRAREAYEFRYLAELQVKGKASTVPVYELLCRKGALSDEDRAYNERFEAGVTLYKQRKWDECIVHFTRILSRRFDDLGASRYVDACQEFKRFPPDDKWCGALELTEK